MPHVKETSLASASSYKYSLYTLGVSPIPYSHTLTQTFKWILPSPPSTANIRDSHLKSQGWCCRSSSRVKFSPLMDGKQFVQEKKKNKPKPIRRRYQIGWVRQLPARTYLTDFCVAISNPQEEKKNVYRHADRFLFQEQKKFSYSRFYVGSQKHQYCCFTKVWITEMLHCKLGWASSVTKCVDSAGERNTFSFSVSS